MTFQCIERAPHQRLLRALALLALVASRAASADGPAADATDLARRHYQSASAYFEERRYDEAVREFRESYRLAPRPALLFNIAKTLHKKGDAARALEAYRAYLDATPDATDRPAIEAEIVELGSRTGQVQIANAPRGAEVSIDGSSVGRAPFAAPVAATAGRAHIEAIPEGGGAPLKVEVEVPAGGMVTATLPSPAAKVVEVIKEKVVEKSGPRWYTSGAAWGAFAGGAVVAIAGGVLLGLARPFQDDANRHSTTEAAWQSGQARATLFQDVGIAGLAVGIALVVTGVAVFLYRARGGEAPRVTTLVTPSGAGPAALGVRF
jgi:tetratricopeptide (TPR) repeat protein